jgi:Leucine-rich repeat (LRR) protein
MNKNLSVINQNNKLMLKKSKSLMNITNNILSNDAWMQRLLSWADDNNIPNLEWINNDISFKDEQASANGYWTGISRIKDKLLLTSRLELKSTSITRLPKEIGNLSNLSRLILHDNQLLEIPKEICNLQNLMIISLWNNKICMLPKEISNLSSVQSSFKCRIKP